MISAGDIVVSDQAFDYLALQQGRIESLRGDRAAWLAAYRQSLDQDYRLLRPHLPPMPAGHAPKVLDVGSGVGGIDVMLQRHYGGAAQIVLLDGSDDLPVVERHCSTFNSFAIAERFHRDNGAPPFAWIEARGPLPVMTYPCDLVLSLASWCFHYPPATYLDWVVSCCRAGTVLIVDQRKAHPAWRAQLEAAFTLKAIVHVSDKIDRLVLHAG